ncbi:MAG: AAA family ATPase [Candidatus Kariarchaeaceae archaeon]
MNNQNLLVVGVTGLPSAGKGLVSEVANDYNFKTIVMGDVIRNECKNRGLPITRENSNMVMMQLREEKGASAVAIVTIEWIKLAVNKGNTNILVDGIRSLDEIRLFRKTFPNFILIAVYAAPQVRLERAMSRKRMDDAFSHEAFTKRDTIELDLGIGDAIARSDILIPSVDSIEHMKIKIGQIMEDLLNITKPVGVLNG